MYTEEGVDGSWVVEEVPALVLAWSNMNMVATLALPLRGKATLPQFAGCQAGRLTGTGISEPTHMLKVSSV